MTDRDGRQLPVTPRWLEDALVPGSARRLQLFSSPKLLPASTLLFAWACAFRCRTSESSFLRDQGFSGSFGFSTLHCFRTRLRRSSHSPSLLLLRCRPEVRASFFRCLPSDLPVAAVSDELCSSAASPTRRTPSLPAASHRPRNPQHQPRETHPARARTLCCCELFVFPVFFVGACCVLRVCVARAGVRRASLPPRHRASAVAHFFFFFFFRFLFFCADFAPLVFPIHKKNQIQQKKKSKKKKPKKKKPLANQWRLPSFSRPCSTTTSVV